jgi:hypothetical protein
MPNVIPFPARRVRRFAEWLLISSASHERLSKPEPWTNRPQPPEPLGNMLQRIALQHPALVLLFESVVAEVVAQMERQG